MNYKHCYLFALEVVPLEVDHIYETLPFHCTLVHRFWCNLTPEELVSKVKPIFEKYGPITFRLGKKVELGPKKTVVFELADTEQLKALHMDLYNLLNELRAEYTEPDWVGPGYTPHVSDREDAPHKQNDTHTTSAAYIIEVKIPSLEHKRVVRQKIAL